MKMWGALALAGVLLVSAAVASAAPPAGKEPPAHPQKPAWAGAKNATGEPPEKPQTPEKPDAPGNASAQERGHGIVNALQHAPEHVRAHLQSVWDALHSGLRGIGDALTKPLRPTHG